MVRARKSRVLIWGLLGHFCVEINSLWKKCERLLNVSLHFIHLAFLALLPKRIETGPQANTPAASCMRADTSPRWCSVSPKVISSCVSFLK